MRHAPVVKVPSHCLSCLGRQDDPTMAPAGVRAPRFALWAQVGKAPEKQAGDGAPTDCRMMEQGQTGSSTAPISSDHLGAVGQQAVELPPVRWASMSND